VYQDDFPIGWFILVNQDWKGVHMLRNSFSRIVILACAVTLGCETSHRTDSRVIAAKMEELAVQILADSSIPSVILRIHSPKTGFTWSHAQGLAYDKVPALPEDAFMSASIGKMMTALLIVKLQEAGLLDLDDSLGMHLSNEVLSNLLVYQDHDYSRQITIRQLLTHTSGLDDVFGGGTPDENGLTPLMQALLAEPDRQWTPLDVIQFYKDHFQAQSAPGAQFRYSDTGYQLLGLVAESAGDQPFHVALWERVLQPLGMTHTYVIGYDTPRGLVAGRQPSTAYFDDIELTFPAVRFDWAGGGLYTTTQDLENALDAIRHGAFLSDSSRQAMLNWIDDGEGGGYGLGIARWRFGGSPDAYMIGHGGATNSFVFYSERHETYVIGTVNQIRPHEIDLGVVLLRILEILEDAE
jgi:CubicO group peptidase (beta-lactamase class C family)